MVKCYDVANLNDVEILIGWTNEELSLEPFSVVIGPQSTVRLCSDSTPSLLTENVEFIVFENGVCVDQICQSITCQTCRYVNLTISSLDLNNQNNFANVVEFRYFDCNGDPQVIYYGNSTTLTDTVCICVSGQTQTLYELVYFDSQYNKYNAQNSTISITSNSCITTTTTVCSCWSISSAGYSYIQYLPCNSLSQQLILIPPSQSYILCSIIQPIGIDSVITATQIGNCGDPQCVIPTTTIQPTTTTTIQPTTTTTTTETPCNCRKYSWLNDAPNSNSSRIIYLDCNNNYKDVYFRGNFGTFCAKQVITEIGFQIRDIGCCCDCYLITNTGEVNQLVSLTDCTNGRTTNYNLRPGKKIQRCSSNAPKNTTDLSVIKINSCTYNTQTNKYDCFVTTPTPTPTPTRTPTPQLTTTTTTQPTTTSTTNANCLCYSLFPYQSTTTTQPITLSWNCYGPTCDIASNGYITVETTAPSPHDFIFYQGNVMIQSQNIVSNIFTQSGLTSGLWNFDVISPGGIIESGSCLLLKTFNPVMSSIGNIIQLNVTGGYQNYYIGSVDSNGYYTGAFFDSGLSNGTFTWTLNSGSYMFLVGDTDGCTETFGPVTLPFTGTIPTSIPTTTTTTLSNTCEITFTNCNGNVVTQNILLNQYVNICSSTVPSTIECYLNVNVIGSCNNGQCQTTTTTLSGGTTTTTQPTPTPTPTLQLTTTTTIPCPCWSITNPTLTNCLIVYENCNAQQLESLVLSLDTVYICSRVQPISPNCNSIIITQLGNCGDPQCQTTTTTATPTPTPTPQLTTTTTTIVGPPLGCTCKNYTWESTSGPVDIMVDVLVCSGASTQIQLTGTSGIIENVAFVFPPIEITVQELSCECHCYTLTNTGNSVELVTVEICETYQVYVIDLQIGETKQICSTAYPSPNNIENVQITDMGPCDFLNGFYNCP